MCVSLWELSVGMQPLSTAPHAFPSCWRLGLSAKGGGGMGGKGGRVGGGQRRGRSGNIPPSRGAGKGGRFLVSKGQRSRQETQSRGLEIGCRY